MSDSQKNDPGMRTQRLVVPESLTRQLRAFRARVWTTKITEALALACLGLLLAFLTVYVCDRFLDTPREARLAIFIGALALWLVVPWALHRWVWRNRRLDQLARLLRIREPNIGDQLLSVIELADNESEQARSRTLCAAAIAQVAEAAKSRSFDTAAPPTRLRSLSLLCGLSAIATILLAVLFPTAASNAWARFSTPWRDTPRYTFTAIQAIASNWVVPHGEPSTFEVQLADDTRWHPETAKLQIEKFPDIEVGNVDDRYTFQLPPQTTPVDLRVRVGDFSQQVRVEPKLRPELTSASAHVRLPAYLERTDDYDQDVRSGSFSVVEGSQITLSATASRELANARINGSAVPVNKDSFTSPAALLGQEVLQFELSWVDFDGLAGSEPFSLSLTPSVDEFPSILSQDLPRQAVVLDSEQINFQALAADDFGIKRIGIAWNSIDERQLAQPAVGEKILSAGSPLSTSMQVPATFSAADLGIAPQPIEVRLWTEDYFPGRERSYTPAHVLFVLTAEEHAIWISSQLSKWHRASLEVRDQEMQLHEGNKRLRAMSGEELADDTMREELRRQASAENSNARRLAALAKSGEGLLKQAARNPEIGVGHLDRWAEMLQILNDIGQNRMPTVADLLDKASTQKALARPNGSQPSAPQAGKVRSTPAGSAQEPPAEEDQQPPTPDAPQMPQIADVESSQQPTEQDDKASDPSKKPKYNGSKLSLPETTLAGPPSKPDADTPPEDEPEEEEPVQMAIEEQANILAEFEKISDELNNLLANLEGSTLVKRLKAASREQDQVAEKISSRIDKVFGAPGRLTDEDREIFTELSSVETQSSQNISFIMDDMQAYFERRHMNQFKLVLDDMKNSKVLEALVTLGEEIPREQGMSIAQAEYWSDTLDRWGEDLVDAASGGQCPGSKTSDALPPSLILEVLKILEGEVNLREQTRVADQARPAVEQEVHYTESKRLGNAQDGLRRRTDDVVSAIDGLPNGSERFGKELELLSAVSQVMNEAAEILNNEDTGAPAIAAETEAIELLLQCKRINPKAGGGGGSSPGGGGTGTTEDSALALLGSGLNQNERREARDVSQATGEKGRILPEEFRAGLDEYFNRLEQ
jgi:hypothetical protein